jgi:hypothetical protein
MSISRYKYERKVNVAMDFDLYEVIGVEAQKREMSIVRFTDHLLREGLERLISAEDFCRLTPRDKE